MPNSKYDIIIIGGGMAGLSCAAYLAKAGKKIAVIEQHFKLGGYCTSFARKGITFYPAVHWIGEYKWLNDILDELNGEQLGFSRHDPLLRLIGPEEGVDILLSTDTAIFKDSIIKSYPKASSKSIDQLVSLSSKMHKEISKMSTASPELMSPLTKVLMGIQLPFKLRNFMKYNKMPADDLLYNHFPGEELKGLRTTLRSIVPMADASAFVLLMQIGNALQGKGYCPDGGAEKIVDAFAQVIQNNGGDILLKRRAQRIRVNNKKVVGVMLDDETELESNYVVSTIDACQTFNNLIDPQLVPNEFKKRLDRPVSFSAFTVSIITDINPLEHDFNTADTYINSSFSPDDIYGFSGDPDKILIRLTFPTLIDPSVRAKGIDTKLHGIQIMAIAWFEYENFWKAGPELQRGAEYREFKKVYADKLIKRVEEYIPDLSNHIIYSDISTPISYYRYTLNHYGASLGWDKPPSWKQKCSYIEGLYQAGHWTFPGPMLNGVIPSGKFAAELILKQD